MKPNYIKFQLDEDSLLPSLVEVLFRITAFAAEHHLRFDAMPAHQLHMTVVFLGDIMKGMKKTDREALTVEVNRFDLKESVGLLTFESFEFFGKHQNLLIAKFSTSEAVTKQIIAFKKQFVQFGAIEEDFFLPHITLGKLSSIATLSNEATSTATGGEVSFCKMLQELSIPSTIVSKVVLV